MIEAKSVQDKTAEVLPEFWPLGAGPEVARAWWIPWPVAVFLVPLLWVMPKRMGVHFAAVRWPGVILGHLVWTIYGIGCVAVAFYAPHYGWIAWLTGQAPGQADPGLWPPPAAWDVFRAPLALEAVWLGQTIGRIETYLLAWGAVLGVEVGLAAIGLLLMPYVTVGERTLRLMARCVNLTLWATTSAVVLGLALQAAALKCEKSAELPVVVALVCCGYVVWMLWMWWRSGLRYWGPAEGYAWQARRPTCERCGYTLTGLTAADRCPECGREVAESMPERRSLPAYALARGLGKIPAFFRTIGRVVTGRRFADRLAVHGGHEAARSFSIVVNLAVTGVGALVALPIAGKPWDGWRQVRLDGPWVEIVAVFLVLWTGLFIVALAASSILALVTSVLDRRDLQTRATICFLHSGWNALLGPLGALTLVSFIQADRAGSLRTGDNLWTAVGIVALSVCVVAVSQAIGAPFVSSQRTRFANA